MAWNYSRISSIRNYLVRYTLLRVGNSGGGHSRKKGCGAKSLSFTFCHGSSPYLQSTVVVSFLPKNNRKLKVRIVHANPVFYNFPENILYVLSLRCNPISTALILYNKYGNLVVCSSMTVACNCTSYDKYRVLRAVVRVVH